MKRFFLLVFCFITLQVTAQDSILSLAQVYKDYFLIGVAVSPRALKTDEAMLITSHQ